MVFRELEPELPYKYRNAIWDYIGICGDLNRQLLLLACRYMEFPDDRNEE